MMTKTEQYHETSQVVILGGGFAGAYCAKALGKRGVDVLLVDRHDFLVYSPLLVEAGTGTVEPRHAIVSLRSMLPKAEFRLADVVDLDTARKKVSIQLLGDDRQRIIAYEHLVISLGSETRLADVPGVREHAFEMKDLADGVALRDRSIELVELADAIDDCERRRALLHLIVVGGNFTGVEVASEFHEYLRRVAKRCRNVRPDDCRVTLIEIESRILSGLDTDLGEYAAKQMQRRGVQILVRNSVVEVHSDHVRLANGDRIDSCTTVWCAGIEPRPPLERLGLPSDTRGYVLCDPDLRVQGMENIWAIGDCAANPDPHGQPYPATGQHAMQEGRPAALNIVRTLHGKPTRPFVYKSKGTLVPLGHHMAVAKVFGFKLSGTIAWLLWKTIYLIKLPGLGRKVRVALDWTADLVFTHDDVQFGSRASTPRCPSTMEERTFLKR